MTSNHVPLISAFKMTFRMTHRKTLKMTYKKWDFKGFPPVTKPLHCTVCICAGFAPLWNHIYYMLNSLLSLRSTIGHLLNSHQTGYTHVVKDSINDQLFLLF